MSQEYTHPPRRKPFQVVLNDRERRKAEFLAGYMGVSISEALRHALMHYRIEEDLTAKITQN